MPTREEMMARGLVPPPQISLRPIIRIAGGALIVLLLFIVFLGTYFTVPQNERAVLSRWGEFNYVAEPGLHFKIPFRDSATFYPTGILDLTSGKEWINTYTIDSQEVDVTFTVFYRLPPERIQYIYANNRDYESRLWKMTLDRVKAEMGKVNTQMVAEKRGEIRDAIRKILAHDATTLGVEVVDFQLTDLKYTDTFRAAINAAAVQKANIEAFEYQRQQAEKTAQTDRVKAEGQANAMREDAKGRADAVVTAAESAKKAAILAADADAYKTRTKGEADASARRSVGEAEAAAIKAQAEALKQSSDLTELRKVERWNGALPSAIYAGAPIPFLQVK